MFSVEEETLDADFIASDAIGASPVVSPDGRWVAYHADFSGQAEVYVERFPELGERQRVSSAGGRSPRWSPEGDESFYLSPTHTQFWVTPIELEPSLSIGVPEVLFEGQYQRPHLVPCV